MFGHSLDPLHTDDFDRDALKEWVDTLSTLVDFESENGGEVKNEFTDLFLTSLYELCVYVAAAGGDVSDDTIREIAWLTDEKGTSRQYFQSAVDYVFEKRTMDDYPFPFQVLVGIAGRSNKDAWLTTGEIANFYKQIARYVYSLDHEGGISDNEALSKYIDAFDKYVERVSVIGYDIPEETESISETLKIWERLSSEDEEKKQTQACGTWRAVSGNTVGKHGLSDLVLKEGGSGYMTRKKLFGTEQVPVTWEIDDPLGIGAFPIVHIPSMQTHILFTPTDDNRMMGVVKSTNPRLNDGMAIYHLVYPYEAR